MLQPLTAQLLERHYDVERDGKGVMRRGESMQRDERGGSVGVAIT